MNETRLTAPEHDPYLLWRRLSSIERYVEGGVPGVIDIDAYEYCPDCYRPVAVTETKKPGGNDVWSATRALARALGVPGYLVRYEPSPDLTPIPGDIPGAKIPADAGSFEVTNLRGEKRVFTPQEWADHLVSLHRCGCQ